MLDFCFLFTMQGQCKPNAESLLYAEVQPVLALFRVQRYIVFRYDVSLNDHFRTKMGNSLTSINNLWGLLTYIKNKKRCYFVLYCSHLFVPLSSL